MGKEELKRAFIIGSFSGGIISGYLLTKVLLLFTQVETNERSLLEFYGLVLGLASNFFPFMFSKKRRNDPHFLSGAVSGAVHALCYVTALFPIVRYVYYRSV